MAMHAMAMRSQITDIVECCFQHYGNSSRPLKFQQVHLRDFSTASQCLPVDLRPLSYTLVQGGTLGCLIPTTS